MKRLVILLVLALAAPLAAEAQKEPPGKKTKGPAEPRGVSQSPRKSSRILGQVAMGDPAPTFELDAPDGKPVKLTSLRGSWVVLVFADRWQQLGPVHGVHAEIDGLGAKLVGLCHEKAQTLSGVMQRESFPPSSLMLADATGQVSAAYGLYNYERSETQPGVLILDPQGIIQLAILGQLPPPDAIARLARFAITGL